MERLAELISKLKEQFEQKADPSQLLVITQMIEEQLTRSLASSGKQMSTSKVAVVMPQPRVNPYQSEEREPVKTPPAVTKQENAKPETVKPEIGKLDVVKHEVFTEAHRKFIPAESKPPVEQKVSSETKVPAEQKMPTEQKMPVEQQSVPTHEPHLEHLEEQLEAIEPHPPKQTPGHWAYDPMKDIPTLASQKTFKELNEVIGIKDSSLNDRLKAEVIEIGHRLTESPIRDLKRAIGVNDRFLFINELFRGDEVMYERSIKTINGFRIYAEAEYWIERELKVKLGWEEDKPVTRQFIQLVKRRFS